MVQVCGFHWEGLANPACVKTDFTIKNERAAGVYEVVDVFLGVAEGANAYYKEHWEVFHVWRVDAFIEMGGVID